MLSREQCDQERLRKLLDESLPAEIEQELTDHIAVCVACQKELEKIAAEQSWIMPDSD